MAATIPDGSGRHCIGAKQALAMADLRRSAGVKSGPRRHRKCRRWHEVALATMRAARPSDALNTAHERRHRFHHYRIGRGHRERRPRLRELHRLGCRPEQAIVADALEAVRQDMQEKAVDEGCCRQSQ